MGTPRYKSFSFSLLYCIILFLFAYVLNAQPGGWRAIPGINLSEIYKIKAGGEHLFMLGLRGMVKSTDGGETWNSCQQFGGRDVWMFNENSGILAGYGEIYVTNDGWQSGTKTTNIDNARSIFMNDNQTGFTAGWFGYIYKTTDGGQTWTENRQDPSQYWNDFTSIFFNTPLNGHAVGKYYYKSSTDGGETWNLNTGVPIMGEFNKVCFVDQNTGFIVGDYGIIYKSTNGGISWFSQTSNTDNNLKSISFQDLSNGIAVGDNGTILSTSNSGDTWTPLTSNTTEHLNDVLVKSDGEAWIAGTGNLLITNKPQPVSYTLSMGLLPWDAAQDGCTTTPPTGAHSYLANTIVPVSAQDKQQSGWYFKEWTGDASGNDPNINIVMQDHKNVTANFVNLTLTVSGTVAESVICPDSGRIELFTFLPINFTASNDDDWIVNSFNLKSAGSGDEVDDIEKIYVKSGNSVIYEGQFASDDGIIQAQLNPQLIVPAGQTRQVVVVYEFKYDENSYGRYQIRTFELETDGVNAKPQNYNEGLIQGSARRQALTIAPVITSKNKGFGNIQSAVDDSSTTDGDVCYICKGEYEDRAEITKSIILTSFKGKTFTTLSYPPSISDKPIIDIKKDNVTVSSLTFKSPLPWQDKNAIHFSGMNIKINSCSFRDLYISIFGKSSSKAEISNNTFNSVNTSIKTDYVDSTIIKNNTFLSDYYDIYLWQSRDNRIFLNSFFGESKLLLSHSRDNEIYDNNKDIIYPVTSLFLDFNSHDNFVTTNRFGLIFVKPDSKKNIITSNFAGGIAVHSSYNTIIGNIIENFLQSEHSETGIYVGGEGNIISENTISAKYSGIKLQYPAKNTVISKNKIFNCGTEGIAIISSAEIKISMNNIYKNREGIFINGGHSIEILNNKIVDHSDFQYGGLGILLYSSENVSILGNNLVRNCTGIKIIESQNIKVGNNNISDSFCLKTGISVDNSNPEIYWNTISNNNGNGIFLENGAMPDITANNIYGNTEFGINNSDSKITINASGNYWGSQSGPTSGDIQGNVDAANWLSSQVEFVSSLEKDSLKVSPGRTDSIFISYQNFSNPVDIININLSDDNGWISGVSSFSVEMLDSAGALVPIVINVPSNIQQGSFDKVFITAQCHSDENLIRRDSFYVYVYEPLITRMAILPDSLTISIGDSVLFTASGYDQFDNSIEVQPVWQTTLGEISVDGLFKVSAEGIALITAVDNSTGIQAGATAFISQQEAHLALIKLEPDSVLLHPGEKQMFEAKTYNQFMFPYSVDVIWTAEGGLIDSYGYYKADSTAGTFSITAEDTLSGISGTAVVIIELPVNVVDNISPDEYKLYQNYLNPFNPATKIRFAVPKTAAVSLRVYDILGREVALLVNEVKKPGYYELSWNANHLASGIYFIYIKSNEYSKVMKTVLIK